MLFRQKELLRWLGVTVFETWFFLLCLTIFTVLLVLKVDGSLLSASTSWFLVFSPLFVSDGLNSYFCIIVFIRQYLDRDFKNALLRAIWSLLVIGLLFVFKFLLCNKLSDSSKLDYSELVMIRACQLH
jgi:ribonuclease P/MRP protein subunit RPP20